MGKPLLRWILRVSGAEAVLEFALARERLCKGAERKYWGHLATTASNQADNEFRQRELLRQEEYIETNPISQLSWEERRAMLIEREKQKRGLEQAFKSPAAPAPSEKPVRVLQAVPEAIEPSVGLSRNEEPEECAEASIDAMTDGHTPSDDHEKRRLDPTGDACIDLPIGAVDLLDASPVECRSNRDHGEASLGRHLGREHEVSADQSPQTKKAKGYSRKAKGECGVRIGSKIDKLLDEIKSQPFSSEDPPAPALGGKAERCADEPAADGGVSGFPLPPEPAPQPIKEPGDSAWDAVCGQGRSLSHLREFLEELQSTPELRAGATLRTLTRLRSELERTPEGANLNDPVVITLRDAAVVMTQLMSRLR